MAGDDKPLVWLHGEVKTPQFSGEARLEAGYLLRAVQEGRHLGLPHSRPLPTLASRCHELRIVDHHQTWRIIYRLDPDAIIIVEIFSKKSPAIPKSILETCRRRLQQYDAC